MAIKIEIALPLGGVISQPLDTTKDAVLSAIDNDPWIDFPVAEGGTIYIPCKQIKEHGAITIFDL